MQTKKIKMSVITLFLLFIGAGCGKDEPLETDPAQIILGKWEIVEMGNYPDMEPVENPSGYKEYLADSVLREYNYKTGSFFYKTYWIDSLLHEGVYRSDGYLVATRYRYNFVSMNNEIKLELHNAAGIYNNFVFQRIK